MYVMIWFVLGYLIGSFPTSVVASRILGGFDIREQGSGNAGATNVIRVLGWKAGVPVALIDVLKGYLPVLLAGVASSAGGLSPVAAGTGAILGHMFPVYARFRGGKGVATSAGAVIALFPQLIPPLLVVFAAVLLATGIVSLSSILAATALPLAYLFFASGSGGTRTASIAFCGFVMVMVVVKHRDNISRLLAGEERRFERIRAAYLLRRLFGKRPERE